jgi:predicted TIM-barrel fold metal-dependent hydrolase
MNNATELTQANGAANNAAEYSLIDADSHMLEPFGMWSERMDARFRDDAPRVVMDYKGKPGKWAVFDTFSMLISRDKDGAAETNEGGGGFDPEKRKGGWDPATRLKDMAADGVAATVLYPTHGLHMFGTKKEDLQRALFDAYNGWLSEFCSYAPKAFAGLGMVSLFDIDQGVKDLEQCRKRGLRGALIWGLPPEAKPYFLPAYDKLWRAAEALDMPLHLHLGTYAKENSFLSPEHAGNWGLIYCEMISSNASLQRSLLHIIFSGVFDRFPKLKLVLGEADIAWVPAMMQRADRYYGVRKRRGHNLELSMLPSEYVKRHVWHTFITDAFGVKTQGMAGLTERIMWSTDYPHDACTFPNSRQIMGENLAGVSEADRRKIVHDNVKSLYGFGDE